jgi:hypothetical protein
MNSVWSFDMWELGATLKCILSVEFALQALSMLSYSQQTRYPSRVVRTDCKTLVLSGGVEPLPSNVITMMSDVHRNHSID